MTDQMDGNLVVTHLGLAPDKTKKQAKKNITENIASIMEWWEENKIKPLLGFETSGRQEVFGSLDEVLEMCDQIKGTVPVINIRPRSRPRERFLREPADFGAFAGQGPRIMSLRPLLHPLLGSGARGRQRAWITPIKKGDLKFEPLARLPRGGEPQHHDHFSSPLLEHDAMYMKVIYERVLTKRVARRRARSRRTGRNGTRRRKRSEYESLRRRGRGRGQSPERPSPQANGRQEGLAQGP
jgi:deoxyribonuclease-4